jgi:septation ring formation regulator EzrA
MNKSNSSDASLATSRERLTIWKNHQQQLTRDAEKYSKKYSIEQAECARVITVGRTLQSADKLTDKISDAKARAYWKEMFERETKKAAAGMVTPEHAAQVSQLLKEVREDWKGASK